jgi:uncharacterized HAD superfamily protein
MKKIDEGWSGTRPRAALPGAERKSGTIVGIDCDGVLASDRLLWQVMRKRYPDSIPARYEDLRGYDWPRATDATTQLCLRLSADPAFAGRLAPIPHMADALRHLSAAGYRLHIVTARPESVRGATRRWLARQGVNVCVDEIYCVASGLDKVAVAREWGYAAFVEDNHATAEALGAAGVRSYLLDAPYNRLPTTHSIRVRGWRELLDDMRVPTIATTSERVEAKVLAPLAS